jgi:hypothetical protein
MNPKRKYGSWIVNGVSHTNKIEALRASTKTGHPVSFYFFNSIWNSFPQSLLGKIPLTQLYKERAQQLRDSYDHLVLHYSGGSDSHNVLHTFLSNGIKLDEVHVRWATSIQDKKLHTPNTLDTSARNAASEWDFTIEPALKQLRATNPEIKITINDFAQNLHRVNTSDLDKRFVELSPYRGALGTFAQRLDLGLDDKVTTAKNRSVGHIFGIEKPMLSLFKNKIYMQFVDTGLETSLMAHTHDNEHTELFYWSPSMPLLPLEQAYQTALWYKSNPSFRNLLWNDPNMTLTQAGLMFDAQSFIYKSILYPHSWDSKKFQVRKPNPARSDWWFWIHESPELTRLQQGYKSAVNDVLQGIAPHLIEYAEGIPFLKPVGTRLFHILDLD